MKPNVFLVGFPKSGTTSVYNSLATHPQVLAPQRKEPGDCKNLSNFDGVGADDYLAIYSTKSDFLVAIDGTTRYSLNPYAAQKIKRFSPEAKIIIGIREPLSYLYSMAFQIEKNTGLERDLLDDINSEENKIWTHLKYVETVNSYFTEFGRDNVYVFTFEELKRSQKELIEKLVKFIGLDQQKTISEVVSNTSKRHKTKMHRALYEAVVLSDVSISVRSKMKKSKVLRELVFPVLRKKMEDATFEVGGTRKRLPLELEKRYRESYRNEVAELSDLLGTDLTSLWSDKNFSYFSNGSSQERP